MSLLEQYKYTSLPTQEDLAEQADEIQRLEDEQVEEKREWWEDPTPIPYVPLPGELGTTTLDEDGVANLEGIDKDTDYAE